MALQTAPQETVELVSQMKTAGPEEQERLLREILPRLGTFFTAEAVQRRPADVQTAVTFLAYSIGKFPAVFTPQQVVAYLGLLLPALLGFAAAPREGLLDGLLAQVRSLLLLLRPRAAPLLATVVQELVVLLEDLAEVWLYLCHSAAPLLDGPIAISFLGQSAALADCAAGELAVPSLAACMAVQHGLTELLARLLCLLPHQPHVDRLAKVMLFQAKALPGRTQVRSLFILNALLVEGSVPGSLQPLLAAHCLRLLVAPAPGAPWPAWRTAALDLELAQCLHRLDRPDLISHVLHSDHLPAFLCSLPCNVLRSPDVLLRRVVCDLVEGVMDRAGHTPAAVPAACQALQRLLAAGGDAAVAVGWAACVRRFCAAVCGMAPAAEPRPATAPPLLEETPEGAGLAYFGARLSPGAATHTVAVAAALTALKAHVGTAVAAVGTPVALPDFLRLAALVRGLAPFPGPATDAVLAALCRAVDSLAAGLEGPAPPAAPVGPALLLLRELLGPRPDLLGPEAETPPSRSQLLRQIHGSALRLLHRLMQPPQVAGRSTDVLAPVCEALPAIVAAPGLAWTAGGDAGLGTQQRDVFNTALHSDSPSLQAAAIAALPVLLAQPGPFAATARDPALAWLKAQLRPDTDPAVLAAIGHHLGTLLRAWRTPTSGVGQPALPGTVQLADWRPFFDRLLLCPIDCPAVPSAAVAAALPAFLEALPLDAFWEQLAFLQPVLDLLGSAEGDLRASAVACVDVLLLREREAQQQGLRGPLAVVFQGQNVTPAQGLFDFLRRRLPRAAPAAVPALLEAVRAVAVHGGGATFPRAFFALLAYVAPQHPIAVRAHAMDQVHAAAGQKGLDIAEVFQHCTSLYSEVMALLPTAPTLVSEVANILDLSLPQFVEAALPHCVPVFTLQRQAETLKAVATLLGGTLEDLLVKQSGAVLAHLLLFGSDGEELPDGPLRFLFEDLLQDRVSRGQLALTAENAVMRYLLGYLGEAPAGEDDAPCVDVAGEAGGPIRARANRALRHLLQLRSEADGARGPPPAPPPFLCTKFLGLMDTLTSGLGLTPPDTPPWQKRASLRALTHLVLMLGPGLGSFVTKLMCTLEELCLKCPAFRAEACRLLPLLLKTLDEEALRANVSQIIVGLTRLLPFQDAAVAEALRFLLLDHAALLDRDTAWLHLDDFIARDSTSLPESLRAALPEKAEEKYDARLKQMVAGLQHVNPNVRLVTLHCLKNFLLKSREQVIQQVNQSSHRVDPAINDLVARLLQTCTETASRSQRLHVAECLGLLGAVDPARLQLAPIRLFETIHDDIQFAVKIMTEHLLRFLRDPSNYKVVDRAAYALQELLRFCLHQSPATSPSGTPVSPGEEAVAAVEKCGWWTALDRETRATLTPYLRTNYRVQVNRERSHASPVYRPGDPCRLWLKQWIFQLIERASGKRRHVFKVLRGVVKEHPPMCLFILPYLVLNVCMYGTDGQRRDIEAEIATVVGCARGGEHVQIVFQLLDELAHWVDEHRYAFTRSQRASQEEREAYARVKDFVDRIPRDKLAKAAFSISACARAYMYYEDFLRGLRDGMGPAVGATQSSQSVVRWCDPEHVSFLQRIYSLLHERDGLAGIATLRATTTIVEQTLDYETTMDWSNALNCYELLLQSDPMNAEVNAKLLGCQRNLGQFSIMLRHAEGVLSHLSPAEQAGSQHARLVQELHSHSLQAAWRLGDWALAEQKLRHCPGPSFEVGLARCLVHLRAGNAAAFQEAVGGARGELLPALGAASMESYERAYPTIVQLQMLSDLERAFEMLSPNAPVSPDGPPACPKAVLQREWDARVRLTENTPHTREPLLSLHRAVYGMQGMADAVAASWLRWAKLSRKAGHHQSASAALLQAGRQPPPPSGLYIEQAKLLYQQGQKTTAIAIVESPPKDLAVVAGSQVTLLRAKMQLLAVNWSQATNQKQSQEVMADYQAVIRTDPDWEKGHFFLAAFLDKLLARQKQDLRDAPDPAAGAAGPAGPSRTFFARLADLLPRILDGYGTALTKGSKHLYHSLPRMLTLWFDYADELLDPDPEMATRSRAAHARPPAVDKRPLLQRINALMRGYVTRLPAYQWQTALSQLVSRISHRDPTVLELLGDILRRIVTHYPQQSLWALLAMCHSMSSARRTRATAVLAPVRELPELRRVLEEGNLFFRALMALCDVELPKGGSFTIDKVPRLKTLAARGPLQVIIPLQSQLMASGLPAEDSPAELLYIHKFHRDFEVMNSMQKPRKFTIASQLGTVHPFLAKPKEDVRKDSRMMEFTTMINRLLKKDEESRRRKLYVRTFAVLPINEQYGLIEWVNHVTPFRMICEELYKSFGRFVSNGDIKALLKQAEGRDTTKLTLTTYRDVLLPHFPPVFYRWFLNNFPQPNHWLLARLAYCRTTSVWSMVGSVLGLGDRHGENILFDSTTGDTVHVDFSCLFDKGTTLEIPEVVPFRLTPNMRDALGLAGVEGVYRRSCEAAMQVLRDNHDTLMGVLETFVHDPLMEWSKPSIGDESNPAHGIMKKIDRRLCGFIENETVPLSVEGQVQKLISQATSPENLSRMYIWWMPWL